MLAANFAPAIVLYLAILVFYVAAYWQLFAKAGEPGWGALVPIYNLYLYCKIAGRPEWWLILFFIPLVNVVIALILAMDIAGTPVSEPVPMRVVVGVADSTPR